MWVACAKRDLLLGEIDLVIKLRDLQQGGLYTLEDELRTRFGSFFTISDGDDGDSEEDIPSNFSIATVKFSHASVGQYFRTQGFHKGIGIDLNVARAHVLQTCLLFLTDHIPKKNGEEWSPPDLLGYSADHLLDHLVEVDIEALRNSQPKKFSNISDEVFFLFRNSDALGRWYSKLSDKQKLIYQLFGRTDICSRIQEWIPGHTAASRPEARWLKQARSSPQALLRPFAQFIAKLWLGYNRMDGFIPIVFLDGYISMRPLKQIVQKMSPIHIRRIASYGNLKRTILWHLYLGTTLMHVATPQHIIAAIREFRRAKQAVGLYCLQLYRESIEAAAHALEQEEFQDEESKCALLGLVRLSNLELGDFESAIKAAEEVCRIAPRSPLSVLKMIGTYYTTGRFLESARYIQSIMNHEGLLVDAINANPLSSQLISTTCMESGQLDLAQDIFTRAATEAEASGDTDRAVSAKMALSNLYLRYYDADKAIESWESLAIDPLSTNEGVQVACLLASLYYTKAIDRNEDNEYWTAKLQTMNERLNSRLMGNETHDQTRYDLLGAAALLGRWYMEHGDMQKARLVIQPLIQIGVDELTDRDDANDMVAYSTLGRGLISLGDRQNAEIAWAFGYPLQKSNELQEIEMREATLEPRSSLQPTIEPLLTK
ncbi:hypothetical protein F5Y02DRAFT_411606 [Annulohypoxylon stygium]|nr:hypothetical protein F5Y02DRAFT_411606 [Annulohypoxylon stygium]